MEQAVQTSPKPPVTPVEPVPVSTPVKTPPPVGPTQTPPPAQPPIGNGGGDSHSKMGQKIFWVVLVVLVLAGGFLLYSQLYMSEGVTIEDTSHEREIVETDLEGKTGQDRLPAGFPLDIPVEADGVTSSYKQTISDIGVNYSVVYRTLSSEDEKYQEYKEYLVNNGYTVTIDQSNEEAMILGGAKEKISLSFVMTRDDQGGQTSVRVEYLQRI